MLRRGQFGDEEGEESFFLILSLNLLKGTLHGGTYLFHVNGLHRLIEDARTPEPSHQPQGFLRRDHNDLNLRIDFL